ncbi:MAG TPA: CDP-glycerol glycerophosphotransferase family protein [Propionibacteriaceae bacterium]
MKFVYNSFNGRYSDNPRAIHRAMLRRGGRHEHVWLLDERHRAGFPRGVSTVPIASHAAVAALEAADVLVANCHTDLDSWEKRPGTTYLQTWHGTPLKRIHRAALQGWGVEVMDVLDTEIERWDRLITPSRAGTQLLRSAFGYTGAVLETGYPRNDVLVGAGRDERRAQVRRRLGIADDTTAVLYAPTYRDDELDGADVPLALDTDALAGRLGDGHVLLLRLHYFLGHRRTATRGPHIQDLSSHPEIADLYLAADVLVTDYSSALFDFAVTGKPILLYTYDLEHYRDRLRGFTVDLEAEAPGPLLHDQLQLTEALLDLPQVVAAYEERYAAFRERYCHLEDGHATERVLATLQ